MVMTCACGSDFQCRAIEEWDAQRAMLCYTCRSCGFHLGIEANDREASGFFARPVWTDEAQHRLDRLPPYVAPLVQQEMETYAVQHRLALISTGLMMQTRHHGLVSWHPDAERRLSRIPAAVRAMARAELERTAQDREMPEVTVALMDDIKARYFGVAMPTSRDTHGHARRLTGMPFGAVSASRMGRHALLRFRCFID